MTDKIQMETMDRSGDTKYEFDPNNAKELEAAKETFNMMKKKGFTAFRLRKWKDRGELLKEFDPKVRRMLFVPMMSGG